MRRQLRRRGRDIVAVLALLTIGIVVGSGILLNQRFTFPAWVPVIGTELVELEAEFESAQAVTPGQGQTVNLSGVPIGEVAGVELAEGVARVRMRVQPRYLELIHEDAVLLLRPRTGLGDMTVEIDPGSGGPTLEPGAAIPVAQTAANVQPDEILSTLDGDTRAYLKLLVLGAGEGLDGRGAELAQALRRFEPTARDLAAVNGALAARRSALERAVTAFANVSAELGAADSRLGSFVSTQADVLGGFARSQQAIRDSLAGLPGALAATREALLDGRDLSLDLEPALERTLPAARELGPALASLRPMLVRTEPALRNQIRPFTRAARRPLGLLRRTSAELGAGAPSLGRGLGELNLLLNQLAYRPPGAAVEGYLFWLAWLNHNTNALFTVEDAGGPLRRGLVLLSCQTAQLADGVSATRPFLLTLQDLTGVPSSDEVC